MAYHEHNPWREPQRTKPTSGRIIFGCILALAVFIALAIIEIQAALIVAALAVISGLILVIGGRLSRRHR
jgi:Flp pilus assembly protein TadB